MPAKKKVYISLEEAAKRLKVSRTSIKHWATQGLLPYKIKHLPVMYVDANSLKNVFYIDCAWCGKRVKVKRPLAGKYCSDRCQKKFNTDRRKKEARKKPRPTKKKTGKKTA